MSETVEVYLCGVLTDYGNKCHRVTISGGRQRLLERHRAASCVLELDNSDGTFDPLYNAAMYPGGSVAVQWVTAGGALTLPLFRGTIDAFDVEWRGPSSSTCTITATDSLKLLALYTYDGLSSIPAGTAALDAMNTIVAGAGLGSVYSLTGNSGEPQMDIGALTGNALEMCQTIAAGESGEFYAAHDSTGFVFVPRSHLWYPSSVMFSDTPGVGEYDYDTEAMAAGTADDFVRNAVTVTRSGGTAQTVTNSTSITNYSRREYSLANYAVTDVDAYNEADFIVEHYKTPPTFEVSSLSFDAHLTDAHLALAILARGGTTDGSGYVTYGTRVTVEKTPPYGSQISRQCFVTSIRHDIANRAGMQTWRVTLGLADATGYPTTGWRIGDATYGKIGTASIG